MPRAMLTSLSSTCLTILLALHVGFSIQLNCYDVDGTIWSDNIQCPGSQSCCADLGQCTSNKLCAKEGTLVRGPCLNAQFDDCSPLCHYTNDRNFLPRVHQCPDGRFCCDNSPDCCNNGTGVLLSPNGNIISNTVSLTTISSTSSSSSIATTTAASSSSSSPEQSRKSAEPTDTSTRTGASDLSASASPSAGSAVSNKKSSTNVTGIVVGVVVAVVVVAVCAGLLILRQRRRIKKPEANFNGGQAPPYAYAEMDAPFGPRQDEAKLGQPTHPAEMRGLGIYDMVAELPNSPRRSPPHLTSSS